MVKDFDMVSAYVNHGRWLVDCPGCNTGWCVRPETPSLLLDARGRGFTECKCGRGVVVQFPNEMPAIDEVLGLREQPVHRNWRPGETVIDLRIENAAHGVFAEGGA